MFYPEAEQQNFYSSDINYFITLTESDSVDIQSLDVPIPSNEAQRLLLLKQSGLLDSNTNDPDFDRLSAMTSRIFQAPFALITFMKAKTSWFKSKYGDAIKDMTYDMRNDSFCTYTIMPNTADVFVVLDAANDNRFKHKNNVKNGARFYAGAPIILDEIKIGAVCILDVKTRDQFTLAERTNLLDMAATVSDYVKKCRDYNIGTSLVIYVCCLFSALYCTEVSVYTLLYVHLFT